MSRKQLSMTCLAVLCLMLISALCGYATEQDGEGKSRWIRLFNGKNLDGWKVKITGYELGNNFGNTFLYEIRYTND